MFRLSRSGANQLRTVARRRLGGYVAVLHLQRVDPSLATREDADQVPELDQLRLRKMSFELGPHRVVGGRGIPGDRVGVAQRYLLAVGELVRVFKMIERG
jgi:hypothetical protein